MASFKRKGLEKGDFCFRFPLISPVSIQKELSDLKPTKAFGPFETER